MAKILDDNYYDLMIDSFMAPEYNADDNITALNHTHSLLHIYKEEMNVCDLGYHPYRNFPALYTLTTAISPEPPGIGVMEPDPSLSLLGQCVLIGVIDTGIDYRHPAFRNYDGSSRIVSIWDQTVQTGRPPEGFTFGTEYNRQQINTSLNSDESLSPVPSTDTNGHGTAIASIIAGSSEFGNSHIGAVPFAELVIVKLKEAKQNLKNIYFVPEDELCFQESDIILGIRYLASVAQRLNRPIVICIALGSSQGNHDGQNILSQYIESLVQLPGIDVSVAAGDEGNRRRHYFNYTAAEPYYNAFQLNIGNHDRRFAMEIWPYVPGKLSIEISSPAGESTGQINPAFEVCYPHVFQPDQSKVWINNIIFEEETGNQLILIRFEKPAPGIWSIQVENTENQPFSFHSWLPSGNLLSDETFFPNANPDTTITAPGNALPPLTTAAYDIFNGSILDESGKGFTGSGQVKPDIAAPGYQIPCAIPGNQYGTMTGTGAAAAYAAGTIAMVMEWTHCKGNYTALTGKQINRLIIRAAQRDSTIVYPNHIWGYGQLYVKGIIDRLMNIL